MERLREEFINEAIKIIGKRKDSGKCYYCGKQLSDNEYCDCSEAKKFNRYFKKVQKKIAIYNDYISLNINSKDAYSDIKRTYKTPALFDGFNFDDYIVESDSEKNGKAAAEKYFKNAISNFLFGKNLVLIGGFGTGKTMLESILCNNLAERWLFSCQFINAVDLKGEITKCFNTKTTKTVDEVVNRYKKADFLFLDDIDKLTPTEYVREFVYSLVNYRVENQLPIITSANHTLEELDSKFYGEAIVSRLINNSPVISFTHKNRRFQ